MEEELIISKELYESLVKDSNFLSCLREVGVDNWEGLAEAWKLYHILYEEEEE